MVDHKSVSKKAKEFDVAKLMENPSEVNEHVERFRKLVTSKPHLSHPTDSDFLLKFLRVAKFDHKKAEANLDKFCTLKGSPRGVPEYFYHININSPVVEEYLGKGIIIPLGRNEAKELIILFRYNMWDPVTIPLKWFINLVFMTLDIVAEEEQSQTYGIQFIHDMTNTARQAMVDFSDPEVMKNLNRIFHESYYFKLRGEVFYNGPDLFDINYRMYTFFKSDKKKGRVFRVKGNTDDLMEKIPGGKKIMPAEYGGQAGPIRVLAEKWKIKFKDYYKRGDPRINVSVDESIRPEETLDYWKKRGEYNGPTIKNE